MYFFLFFALGKKHVAPKTTKFCSRSLWGVSVTNMHQDAMRTSEAAAGGGGSGDGGIVHNDPDLAAFLKQLVAGEEAAENDDKSLGNNVWDALNGDDIPGHCPPHGVLDGMLGRTEGSKDHKGLVPSPHDIFLDEETEKVLVRNGGRSLAGGGDDVRSTFRGKK